MSTSGWKVKLRKERATWYYYTENPQGGGFGSNYCGPQYVAKSRAITNIPEGETYELFVNGESRGIEVKPIR